MKDKVKHINSVSAPLFIVGVLYYLLSMVYHTYAIIDNKYWDCFYFVSEFVLIIGLLYIIYRLTFKSNDLFMIICICLYKTFSIIADIYGLLTKEQNEYILFLTNPKMLIPICIAMAAILFLIIRFYKLWTR